MNSLEFFADLNAVIELVHILLFFSWRVGEGGVKKLSIRNYMI